VVVTVFVVLVSGFRLWVEYAIKLWPSAGAAA